MIEDIINLKGKISRIVSICLVLLVINVYPSEVQGASQEHYTVSPFYITVDDAPSNYRSHVRVAPDAGVTHTMTITYDPNSIDINFSGGGTGTYTRYSAGQTAWGPWYTNDIFKQYKTPQQTSMTGWSLYTGTNGSTGTLLGSSNPHQFNSTNFTYTYANFNIGGVFDELSRRS